MRPQWLQPHTEVRTEGYDLMLAVDASHSMDALDFTVDNRQVSRMSVIKGVMGRFIQGRKGDRIGLVIFGSQAFVLSPLTLDVEAVNQLLQNVVPSIAGQGTAMGDAIALGVKKLRERPVGSRVLVLIADGENTAGMLPPDEAARLAAHEQVRIYSIGVGSDQKEVAIFEGGRVITRTDLGFDEKVMQAVAELTGGAYFRATDTRALEEIYQRIDELEKTEAEARSVMLPTPLYRWPLGVALLIALVLGLFPEGQRRVLRRSANA
jgi:Ca-activated chloride channel family protein